jgi:acyl-CoA thioester hydrolase
MTDVPRYTLAIRVMDADIDRQGHVNNVAWVVRRHEIEYMRPGSPGDELEARTWVGEPSGATWERLTEVYRRGEDRPLVTARTIWVLLDAATGRPRRIDSNLIARFADQRGD